MFMNIYIQPNNEELLQKYKESGKSMSSLINALIMEHFTNPKTNHIEFYDAKLMLREFYKVPTNKELDERPTNLIPNEVVMPKAVKPWNQARPLPSPKPIGYETPSQKADRAMREEMAERLSNRPKLG